MRKIFSVLLLGLAVLVFHSCNRSQNEDISLMNFYYSGDDYGITLQVRPDYTARLLDLDYSKVFSSKPEEEDVVASGSVGDEYFDRFEQLVELFPEESFDKSTLWSSVNEPLFEVEVNEVVLKAYFRQPDEKIDLFKNFYSDIEELLTAEEQV